MRRLLWLFTTITLMFAIVPSVLAQPATAAERCFTETGYCVSGSLRAFWERNGAESVFGFPTGLATNEIVNGKLITHFPFQRFRIDYDATQPEPYTYQLGIMGEERLLQEGRVWQNEPPAAPKADCHYFTETKHNVCAGFWSYWQSHGLQFDQDAQTSYQESLALLGYPLTEEELFSENGTNYAVQWFQRGRMEFHPENLGTPYTVQLGLLNNEIAAHSGHPFVPAASPVVAQPPAQPAPMPTAAPIPRPEPTAPPHTGERVGAVCRDGTRSSATGRGACSHHGGVDHWIYA